MTIYLLQLTVCHIWVCGPLILADAVVAMLRGGLFGSCTFVIDGLRGGWKYTGAVVLFFVDCRVCMFCQGTWRSAATATTLGFEAAGILGAFPVGVNVRGVLAAMLLRCSLITSRTRL